METVKFLGLDCAELTNGTISLLVTQSVGPRVISLKINQGKNILAELPHATLDCPGKGDFHLYGGHRLWHAPEDPALTYLPDDDPVEIKPVENGLEVTKQPEEETRIQKDIKIKLVDENKVTVTHTLTNAGLALIPCAPWAITQVKPGGVAILPQNQELWDQNPTLPNRPLVLWPYTDINSPYIEWGNQVVMIRADMKAGHLKIGFPNPRGWLAYWRSGTLFIKRAAFDHQVEYYDFGSSSECYCNDQFLELETLGPKVTLRPGESTEHVETWELYDGIPWPDQLDDLVDLIEKLGG
jgi:hypothetical protein